MVGARSIIGESTAPVYTREDSQAMKLDRRFKLGRLPGRSSSSTMLDTARWSIRNTEGKPAGDGALPSSPDARPDPIFCPL